MSQVNVIRAWKDEEYRLSLSEAERAALPQNPAGLVELPEADLANAAGGVFLMTPVLNDTNNFCHTWLSCQTCVSCRTCWDSTCWFCNFNNLNFR